MPRKKKSTSAAKLATSESPAASQPIIAEKTKGFPIVGIGASAGGLEALDALFDKMPADSHIAFVIIQHLSPTHKSIMRDLLQKHTPMKVVET